MSGWRSILCATGLGDGCRIAVEQAAAIAGGSGARLALLHVTPAGPRPPSWSNLGFSPAGIRDVERLLEHQRVAAERLCGGPVSARLREGAVVAEVLRALQEAPFDLLVIGARRRASLGWLVMGAVASRLVREAPCPVLVARPAEGAQPDRSSPAGYGTEA
jgi:nucleotide-binding universal stress UspA family protein